MAQRKTPPFDFLDDNNWKWMYLDKRYNESIKATPGYLSYRNFIVRALHTIYHIFNDFDYCKNKFDIFFWTFMNYYNNVHKLNEGSPDNNLTFIDNSDFLNFYYYYEGVNLGPYPLIEDQTNGCYPLLVKPEKCYAFSCALIDVDDKFERILGIIKSHTKWNKSLQEELDGIYSFDSVMAD